MQFQTEKPVRVYPGNTSIDIQNLFHLSNAETNLTLLESGKALLQSGIRITFCPRKWRQTVQSNAESATIKFVRTRYELIRRAPIRCVTFTTSRHGEFVDMTIKKTVWPSVLLKSEMLGV